MLVVVLLSVSAPAILAASLSLAIKLNLNYIEMGLFVTAAVGGLFDLCHNTRSWRNTRDDSIHVDKVKRRFCFIGEQTNYERKKPLKRPLNALVVQIAATV